MRGGALPEVRGHRPQLRVRLPPGSVQWLPNTSFQPHLDACAFHALSQEARAPLGICVKKGGVRTASEGQLRRELPLHLLGFSQSCYLFPVEEPGSPTPQDPQFL